MGLETTDKIKPIHKFNNSNGATLCKSCAVIITTDITQDLLCPECQEKALKLLTESISFMNKVPNKKYGNNYEICSKINKFLKKSKIF